MAVAFRAAAIAGNGQSTGVSSLPITIPAAAVAGDYAILQVTTTNTSTSLTTPAGWTLLAGPITAGVNRSWLLGRTLAAGNPGSTVTLTLSLSVKVVAQMSVYSGVTATGMIVATPYANSTASTSTSTPTAIGVPAGALVHIGFSAVASTGTTGPQITPPSVFTQPATNSRTATAYGSGNQIAIESAYGRAASAGNYGGYSATFSPASLAVNFTVALPAVSTLTVVTASGSGSGTGTATVLSITTRSAFGSGSGSGAAEVVQTTSGRPTVERKPAPQWSMFSRNPDYALGIALPISAATFVLRHMGVSTAVITTPYTPAAWDALSPGCGIELWRDGQQKFAGPLTVRGVDWDAQNGQVVIKVEAKGDEVGLADRLVFPDPLRAADDQTVSDYWISTGRASTAMRQLISDQAGPSCRSDRQIPGLVLGQDPSVGVSRTWSALFLPVLDQLVLMSVASGANLGLRMFSAAGALTASIVVPRDLSDAVRFSADLSNLVGFSYREEAPDLTDALSAGQGDLRQRLRRHVTTTDPLATRWRRKIWSYIDRRDTADVAELQSADEDALAEGAPTVSLAVTLTDSQAATYGKDWDLGDAITVYVGLPGQSKVASVSDVCREIKFEVSRKGEKITPAIGSYDAKATIPTPTQRQLAAVGARLGGVIARK